MRKNYMKRILILALPAALLSTLVQAQCTVACGTGSNGAYTASSNTTLAGGTYNYTSFTIDAGVTVDVTGTQPLVIYCTGNVLINGTLNASGVNGSNGVTFSSAGSGGAGVAGGANGGNGVFSANTGPLPGSAGNGSGAGGAGGAWSGGGGAGYATAGTSASASNGIGGPAYGNPQINPAVAGSGGAGGSGGYNCGSGGGGGGGGYISISACGTITISSTGNIFSNGGNGGSDGTGSCGGGGGGSGGSVLLITGSTITNDGLVSAAGGNGGASNVSGSPYFGEGGDGSQGRIYYQSQFVNGSGVTFPTATQQQTVASAASSTSTSCNGVCDGTLVGTMMNGTPPYSYNWMPGNFTGSTVSNVCAGTYTLTGTDASGCTTTSTTVVTSPPALVSATSSTSATCDGICNGSLAGTISGGTPGYTYTWTPGNINGSTVSNVCAGSYTLTGTDANGCTTTATAVVTSPPALVSAASSAATTCDAICDGSLFGTVSGGTPGYTYTWTPGNMTGSSVNNVCAGSYTLTGTDANGCTTVATVTLTSPSPLQAITTSNSVLCFGDCSASAAVSVFGGTPNYTVMWMPTGNTTNTITGLCAGTYTVTATDVNGCSTTSTTTVTSPTQLVVTSSHTDETATPANNGTATAVASGGTPGYTYLWMPGNQTTATAVGLDAGTYTCTITDANGCTTTVTETVGTATGITTTDASFSINLFPNPAQDYVQLAIALSQKGNVHVEVFNIVGEKIDAMDFGNVNTVNHSYATAHLSNGVYFFIVTSGTNSSSKKVTVSH